jgi:transcriptional regulator with XRE-family HTH domain
MTETKTRYRNELNDGERTSSGLVVARQIFPSGEAGNLFNYVPADIRRAGTLLGSAMERHAVSAASLSNLIRVDHTPLRSTYIESFIQGTNPNPNIPRIISAAEIFIDEEDANIEEMHQIQEHRVEQNKWLSRMTGRGTRLGNTVRDIRLTIPEPQQSFARKCSIGQQTLIKVENDQTKPELGTLHSILTPTSIVETHPKVAQLARLQAAGVAAISSTDVEIIDFGILARYFRIQNGYTVSELGKNAGRRTRGWVRYVENDQQVSAKNVALTMSIYGASEELIGFMQEKAAGLQPELSEAVITEIGDNYYLTDLTEVTEYPFSTEDVRLGSKIRQGDSFGKKFKGLRQMKGRTQRDFRKGHSVIWDIENERVIPNDYTIVELANDLGLHVLDETTQALLEITDHERKAKQDRGTYRYKKAS